MDKPESNPNIDHGNILVVDDDAQIRLLVTKLLQRQGYHVFGAADGYSIMEVLAGFSIDAIILDVMLPGISGIELCRQIRRNSQTPIILLTARPEEDMRIAGLEGGADDYMTKPFSSRELLARIRAVLRRSRATGGAASPDERTLIRFENWTLDPLRRELLSPTGALVDLSAGEYNLLAAFLEHANRVLSRETLMELAKTRVVDPFDRTIDVQISRLRRKIEPDSEASPLIKTIRGVGYIFVPKISFERRPEP